MRTLATKTPHTIYAENLEDEALNQFERCLNMPGCVQGALMADAHTGYTSPIGGVFAFRNRISPQIVGYDIGCGMCAVKLNITELPMPAVHLKERICLSIPLGTAKHQLQQPVPVPQLGVSDLVINHLANIGGQQLGTLGSGNHFIEIGRGNDNCIWIVIHSGSRNLGHSVAEHYMHLAAMESVDYELIDLEFMVQHQTLYKYRIDAYETARLRNRMKVKINAEGNHSLHTASKKGQAYINDMNYCLEYALANRKHMIDQICHLLGDPLQLCFINRNHNHAEYDAVRDLWIHRKGATHAELGMEGVIPGNMRDGSFIVKGKGNPNSLCSSSHGAGRVLSRKKAKETLSTDTFTQQMVGITTNHTNDTVDEAPDAYKSIFEVIALQSDLIDVIDHIKPIINIKG